MIAPRGALSMAEQVIMGHVQMLDKPPYNAAWDHRYEARKSMNPTEPASSISPKGVQACSWQFPMVMEFPFDTLFQVLVTPEETLLLFQNGQARHLYTDREHPKARKISGPATWVIQWGVGRRHTGARYHRHTGPGRS